MAKIRDSFSRPPSGWRVTDPITGVIFVSNSYRNLRGKLVDHRRSNKLNLDEIDNYIAVQICDKNPPEFCQEWPTVEQQAYRQLGIDGPKLWEELHRHTLTYSGSDHDWVWLNGWKEKIPSYGCSCRSKWKELLAANPPDWSNYFAWSVARHNEVSQSLGKPSFTVEQAIQRWR